MAIRFNLSQASIDRFWAKVDKTGPCWLWIAAKNGKGYGVFGVGNHTDKAHRISYKLINGDIPSGLFVLHKCDIPACVNPHHLFLGTNNDNVKDMISKGRNSLPPAMAGHNRIYLSDDCISKLGKFPDYALADQYKVSKSVISRNRRALGIPSFAEKTGSNGKFKKGDKHSRWG